MEEESSKTRSRLCPTPHDAINFTQPSSCRIREEQTLEIILSVDGPPLQYAEVSKLREIYQTKIKELFLS